jgi:aryl carrier-like protein
MHHSLYDAWTLPRILDMVERAYSGVSFGKHGSFGVFIKYLMNRDVEKTRHFWQHYLSGARHLGLVKHGDNTESPARGFLQSERATRFNSDHHVPATFIHAAVGIVLSQLAGGVNDVVFASTVFGRACPVDGIEDIMGPTIATVPVRVQFQNGQTVKGFLDKLQDHATSMVPHEQEGIQNIRRMSQSCRNACEFQAYLVVKQDDPAYPDEPGSGLLGEWQDGPEQSELTTYPIMMECRVHDEGFKVRMSVSTEVASEQEMELLMDRFHSVLEQLLHSSAASTLHDIVSTPKSGLQQIWQWDGDHNSLNGNSYVEPSIGNGLHNRTNGQNLPVKNESLGPVGSSAEILQRIWADALGLDPSTFSIEDNLFHLGGDSIAAMKVAAAARACGRRITVSNLLRFSTISRQLPHFSVSAQDGTSSKDGLVDGSTEKLQHIWASALGLDPSEFNMEDNFFHLGGDSVIAMKIAATARASGWSIAVSNILKFPTISQQLPHFSARKGVEPVLAIPRPYSLITAGLQGDILKRLGEDEIRNDVLDIRPTTDFQSMTVRDNIHAPRTALNYFSLDLGPSVDSERLQDACDALVSRLEILRTVFVCARGKVWQVVLKNLPVALTRITAQNGDFAELHGKILQTAHNKSFFDHPVVSFTLAHVPSAGYKLVMGISHAQYDGLSVPLILRVLESAYTNTVAPATTPFSAYLSLQAKLHDSSCAYWRALLKSSRLSQGLPRLSPGQPPKVQPHRIEVSGTVALPVIPDGFTVAVVANLAWALLLHTATGHDDIVYVTLASGRSTPVRGIESVVGPCVTLVPVRVGFSKLWAASEMATCVQEQFLALDQGDTVGIDQIREQCTDWPANPAFDSVFFHQGVSDSPEHLLTGAPVKAQLHLNPAVAIHRTTVTTKHLDDGLEVKVQTSSSLMTDRDASALVDAFSAAFSVVCSKL